MRYLPNDFSYDQTRLLALVSAFPFGLGVSSFLKGFSNDNINTKPISEGMTASMLIYPTTLASSFVFDSFGLSSLSALFLFGFPAVVLILLPWSNESLLSLTKRNLFRATVLLGLVNYIYLVILARFVVHEYMLKQAAFFLIIALAINRKVIFEIPQVLWEARKLFIFFICVGVLGHAFINYFESLKIISDIKWINIYIATAIPIFIIPLLGIIFIHPLVLFVIFSPLLSPYLKTFGATETSLYFIWITMLINAQLLSPVSLTTVLAVSNSSSNIFSESFLKHGIYSLKVSCFAYVYILIMLNW